MQCIIMENTLIKLTLHDETKKRAHDLQIVSTKENLKLSHGGSSYRYKVSKVAKIRNRYNQVPHLTKDTNGKVTNSQKTPNYYCSLEDLQDHPTLLVNDVPIQEVVAHKHLGVYLSQSCDWQKHIDLIKEKAWSRINLLRMLKIQ